MLVFMTVAPPADLPTWPGRRHLALLDALAWPGLWAWFSVHWLSGSGIAQGVTLAMCGLAALSRTHTACCRIERYRFTTWRWGKVLFALLWAGICLRLAAVLAG